jgi:hypothetical protein
MIRDSEFEDGDLLKMIQSDSVGRNQYLNKFINALNTVDKNTYISIDGGWGTGKTVFMKQIELLSRLDAKAVDLLVLDKGVVKDFQEKYTVFYYNAWENDQHEDPLQSLLFNLIEHFYAEEVHEDRVNKLVDNVFKTVIVEGIKKLTGGLIDIDNITKVETMEQLVSDITAVNKRKEAVSEIINAILPEGKKLLFIIDELDRCKPEFAVKLLEVAKHYYNDDNVVFVLSTNNRQLAHTVKRYYGNDFDGYGYLDKLYDVPFELPPVDMKKYFNGQLKVPSNSYYVNEVPIEIAIHLKMSMREANRYNSLVAFIRVALNNRINRENDVTTVLVCLLFIPLALALRIHSIVLYDKFISGDGADILKSLYANSDGHIMGLVRNVPENAKPVDVVLESYNTVMNADKVPRNTQNHHALEAIRYFNDTLPLINSVEAIDPPAPEETTISS